MANLGGMMVFWSVLLAASTAMAQDADDDGCVDAYDANGACVSVDAAVGSSTTFGANTTVDAYATVGDNVSVGTSSTIASRASVGGWQSHTSNPLVMGDRVVVARRAVVGEDHAMGDDTVIGRAVQAGPRLTTGTDSVIGYGAQLGSDVTLGADTILGSLVQLGDHAAVSDNGILARGVTIASAPSPELGTDVGGIIGPDTVIGVNVDIEDGARLRKGVTVLDNVTVGASARVGRGSTLNDGATVHGRVAAQAIIGAGATVTADAVVLRGAEVCPNATVPDVTVSELYPVEGCGPQACEEANNLIPVMTSNTDPSGVASASTTYHTTQYYPYQAFTTSNGPGGNPASAWLAQAGVLSGWLRYDFPESTVVGRYEVVAAANFTNANPSTWEFQGSNDGTNWTTLDSQSGQTWTSSEVKSFTIASPGDYDSYRLNISSNAGYGSWLQVGDLRMFCF